MLPWRERRRDVFFSRVAEEAPPEPPRRAPVAEVLRRGDQSRRCHGVDGPGVVNTLAMETVGSTTICRLSGRWPIEAVHICVVVYLGELF